MYRVSAEGVAPRQARLRSRVMIERPLTLLYLEDNLGDVLLLEQAFEELHLRVDIDHLADWNDAMRFLQIKETTRDAPPPPPDLFLFDERTPMGLGSVLIAYINDSTYLRKIPSFIFTARGGPTTIDSSRLITKPNTWDDFVSIARRLHEAICAWRNAGRLPPC